MMGADEKFVREHWEWFKLRFSEPHEGYARGVYVVEIPMRKFSDKDESVALSLAAEFTRDRLKDIAALELAVETAFCPDSENNHCATCELTMPLRKLAIAALEKLKMGMR